MRVFHQIPVLLAAIIILPCLARAQDKPPEKKPAQQKNMPAGDPAPDKPVQLVDAVKGKHPRLLFGAADLPRLKAVAEGPGKEFMAQLQAYLPDCKAPDYPNAKDDTDAQRQGMWRAPTLAVDYALTHDKKTFEQAKTFLQWMIDQDHWQTGEEEDSGMGAANIAVGAGLLYDVLYNDLDPALREKARQKVLLQARRQWYWGHLNGNNAIGYWQGDPQNNHRWHRDAGFALCTLAIAGDGPGDEYLLSKVHDELDFIAKWLPEDGTSHESPSYWVFGSPHLTLAMEVSDRCLGTHYLDLPYFKMLRFSAWKPLRLGSSRRLPTATSGALAGSTRSCSITPGTTSWRICRTA